MQINKVKINSYGKIKDKEINFEKGINIIYGKNETGKSTILNFIINSLYGISKNKKGKELSNFEKYLPWGGDEFSGKIEYQLDNRGKFEIFRNFKKKNPQIFNENMEDISKNFNIDKNKGNEFFYEQTLVDEELFLSTVVVNQEEVQLGKNEQNVLIQKITNLVGTGDDKVSIKRAIERINRRQLDEIGTERTREKPINLINRNIQNLENEKQNLEHYEEIKYEIEENKNKLNEEIYNLENGLKFIYELKLILENEELEKEKIKIQENIINENIEKINIIKNKIKDIEKNENNNLEKILEKNKKNILQKNNLNKKMIIIFIFLILVNILQFIFIKNNIINYIFLLTIPIFLFYFIYLKNKINKKIKTEKNNQKIEEENQEKIKIEKNNLINQKDILEKNNLKLNDEKNKIKNKINLKNNLEKEKIKNKYLSKIEKNKINVLLNIENINYEIQKFQNNLNDKKIKLNTIELEQKNIEPKLDELSRIEEELVNNKEEKVNLEELSESMNLAKKVLLESYEEMKNTLTPKFTENLSENISNITNSKYSRVKFNEEEGIIIELQNGQYVPASKLSIGTIEQLYLSLRLSMVDELSREKMPIILDEVFAYYDSERLKNTLLYLNKRFDKNQIIIFTCTNREEKILNDLNIKYNYVEI